MNIEKTIKNFEKRGYTVKYFPTAAEAAAYMDSEIKGKIAERNR